MRRHGLALILVVGVLGILAVLGSAFAVLSRLERRAASQRVSATQALLLARSGIEDAQARLDSGQDPAYGGEDWDKDGTLNGFEGATEVTRPGILDTDTCPVRQALRPSFFVKDPSSLGADLRPAPRRVRIDGRERGCSGGLSTGTWAIKALPQGGFFVNGGLPSVQSDPASTSDLNTNLRRMFGILAEAIDREDATADDNPVGKADGESLITQRPSAGWASFEQIRDLALGGSRAKLDAFQPYLVLSAWTDKKVIATTISPRAGKHDLSDEDAGNRGYRMASVLRMGNWVEGSGMNLLGKTRTCPEPECVPHSSLTPRTPAGPLVGRAPVDLGWARTKRPALIALLGGLKGFLWREIGAEESINPYNIFGVLTPVGITLDWSAASDDCRTVADSLMTTTTELRTWEQWNGFCDALPLTGTSGLAQGKKDLLKSNFNPNTDTNKFNPEGSLRRSPDKTDILVGSTEFHLGFPRAWKVSACGRTAGKAPAVRVLSMETSPDRLFNLTTQSEFVAGNLRDLDVAGDEKPYRAYGASPYITASGGTGKTFGHTLTGCPSPGISLQTYPAVPSGWVAWDGQLKLATVETGNGEYAGSGTMKFLARFDDSWSADFGGGNLTEVSSSGTYRNGAIWPTWKTYTQTPGNRFPDGVYLEENILNISNNQWGSSIPGYEAAGNIPPSQGTISYWVKPSYDTSTHTYDIGGTRCHFNNARVKKVAAPSPPFPAGTWVQSTACFSIVAGGMRTQDYYGGVTEKSFGCFWENYFFWDSSNDARDEQARSTPVRDLLRRWYLVTCFWDMVTPRSAAASGMSSRLFIDRGRSTEPVEQNTPWSYATQFNNAIRPAGSPVDFTVQEGGKAVFYLGSRGQYPCGGSPDATMDEFAIYDLGLGLGNGTALDGIQNSANLASSRYEAGRYYKESNYPASRGLTLAPGASRSAGEWFSAPVDLGDARIRSLAWSQIVPRGLKAPAGALPEDGDAGEDGRVVLELAHAAVQVPAVSGAAYARDVGGREIDTLFREPRGEGVERRVKAPFRLHAVFQPNLADPLGKAILDPLVLDDVTVTYRPVERPMFSAFREGE